MIFPLPLERFEKAADFDIPRGSVLIHGTLEERSVLPERWLNVAELTRHELFEQESISHFIPDRPDGEAITLRRRSAIEAFLTQFVGRELFLDYTGLSHHVWMPIRRVALELRIEVSCIYVEPQAYQIVSNPRLSDFFDLSTKIRGIAPIPTFSKLSDVKHKRPVLVPLLGFEGTRFKYVIETLQPEGTDIVPIIGVPGFRLEFPFHSYRGNADALSLNRAWENAKFSDAACPFSLFELLRRIQAMRHEQFLQISPIGTKPHALGAALYAILFPHTELVYDHPVRKQQRSYGAGRCHVYHVSEFFRRYCEI